MIRLAHVWLLILALTLSGLTGCAVGLDSVLFVTKTEIAVDLDAEPPSADIGYARREFVLAPVFEDGKVHPVLTTVGVRPGIFDFGSKQSFATGDAAIVMADAMGSDKPYPFNMNGKLSTPTTLSSITTSKDDTSPSGFWDTVGYFFTGSKHRKRYFFGTDTSFGLHVQWSASEIPRSLALGYKRKELSFIPLIEHVNLEPNDNTKIKDRTLTLASLIATANVKSEIKDKKETAVEIGQTFATGAAATLLAADPGVRAILGPRVMPDFQAIKSFKLASGDKAANIALLNSVYNQLKTLGSSRGDTRAHQLVNALDALDNAQYDLPFDLYGFEQDKRILFVEARFIRQAPSSFENITAYYSKLQSSVAKLSEAIGVPLSQLKAGHLNPQTGELDNLQPIDTSEKLRPHEQALAMQKPLLSATEQEIGANKVVLEALDYFIGRLTR